MDTPLRHQAREQARELVHTTSLSYREIARQIGILSYREIARQVGISHSSVMRWTRDIQRNKCVSVIRNGSTYDMTHSRSKKLLVGYSGYGEEESLKTHMITYLRQFDIPYQTEVDCDYGRVDILTPYHIFELKGVLTASSLKEAIGQLVLYNTCFPMSFTQKRELCIVCWGSEIASQHADIMKLGYNICVVG